jgi:hypothetical protein
VKPAHIAGLLAFILAIAQPASAARLQSFYSKITDGPDCAFEQSATEESDLKFDCPGPVEGVSTLLHRGADWDHLHLSIDGKSYSLWHPMVRVGTWSGFGNKKGLVEWLFEPGKPRNRARLKALIVRFEGTVLDSDGNAKGTRSQLAVIDLTQGRLCWKGNYSDNAEARAALKSASCNLALEPETVVTAE